MSDDWDIARIERLAPDDKSVVAARLLLKKKAFGAIQPTADGSGWWAKCAGQTDDYEVSARRPTAGNFDAHCTCPSYKHPCKHAIALLLYLAENPAERPGPPQPQTAPSGDFEGLLANVFQNPDDDLARLVFADFVEEQGNIDRATMIRLQVERASKPEPGKKPRGRPPLPKAEAALAEKLLAGVPESARSDFRWQRGFLVYRPRDARVVAPDTWPASARYLFRDGWVEAVLLPYGWFALTAGPVALYRQVGTLDFGPTVIGVELLAQAAAELRPGEPGSRLRHVVVPERWRAEWQALIAADADAPVQFDAVPYRAFTDPPLRLFARQVAAGVLRGSTAVEFAGRLAPDIARTLAASPDAAGIQTLILHSMSLDAATADILGGSAHLGGLTTLSLQDIEWLPGAAAAWLRWPRLEITGDLTRAWPADAPSLDWSAVSAVVLHAVPGDPGWFAAIAACFPDGLDTLEIRTTGGSMKVAHAKALAAALPILRLRTLGLVQTGLGVRSLQALVGSPGAASLRRLDLSHNPLPESAVAAIADSPHLGQLKELTVHGPFMPATKPFAAALRKRLPKTVRVVAT